MPSEIDLIRWLEVNCPHVWTLLDQQARQNLPNGLLQYASPLSETELGQRVSSFRELDAELEADQRNELAQSAAQQGRDNLLLADKRIEDLITACGLPTVRHTYRKRLNAGFAEQVAELLCEITLCASVSKLSPAPPNLRPPSGKGNTDCEVSFQLAGSTVYAEAKRYEDRWFSDLDPRKAKKRSLVKAPPDAKPQGTARPRAMDLFKKLRKVPTQFPTGTINLLFIFHPSVGDSSRYLQQALFGDNASFEDPTNVTLNNDGLFATGDWRTVSACCLSKVLADGALICFITWENPRADVRVPTQVRAALDNLNPPKVSF